MWNNTDFGSRKSASADGGKFGQHFHATRVGG